MVSGVSSHGELKLGTAAQMWWGDRSEACSSGTDEDEGDRKKMKCRYLIGIIILALLIVGGIVLMSLPTNIKIKAEGYGWERVIHYEKYLLCIEDDWSVPYDAIRIIDRNTEIRTYRSVRTGTDSDGDAIYTSQPVYDTKYTYEIMRWKFSHNDTTTGIDHKPYWSIETIVSDVLRESRREEKYWIDGIDKEKKVRVEAKLSLWNELTLNKDYKVKRNGWGTYWFN